MQHNNDDYTYDTRRPARKDVLWNMLTVLVLLATVAVAAADFSILLNPFSGLNIFQPPPLATAIVLPSATPTLRQLPPTWTVTPTVTSTPTITPPAPVVPTDAVEVTPGPPEGSPVVETDMPASRYAFVLQGEVKAIDATIFRPEHGCNWMGVAGQAFDLQGRPATGITVQVGGSLGRSYVDLISLTGTALWYGQAGYEVFLASQPTATKDSMWVRLLDQSGLPLSAKVMFNTSEDCKSNLVVINFKQVR